MSPESLSTPALILVLVTLTVMSAYFSSSETAMMSLNRYRLKHLVNQKHPGARKASRLLKRPDRLLGVVLLGNNLINFYAGGIASVIGLRFFPNHGVEIATVFVTLFFLVFAETAPKTVAAARPELVAFPSSRLLQPMLRVFLPVVAAINALSNMIAAPLIRRGGDDGQKLSVEEFKTVVNEVSDLPVERQGMLLGILNLDQMVVNDIMVARANIQGINIDDEPEDIAEQIRTSEHTRLPVYREGIGNVLGLLHLRRASRFLRLGAFTKSDLLREMEEPYFVPEGTQLNTQLFNFQKERKHLAFIVDEYGDIEGIVTLEDILEEIVGVFTATSLSDIPEIDPAGDGSFIIKGKGLLRDINRSLNWNLPTTGPRTLNGLILEHLEFIPDLPMSLRIGPYVFEILQVSESAVRTVRAFEDPNWTPEATAQDDEDD